MTKLNIHPIRSLILLALVCWSIGAQAQQISVEEAKGIAQSFFHSTSVKGLQKSKLNSEVCLAFTGHDGGKEVFYIFNKGQNEDGFVIVGAEIDGPEILGYSNSRFEEQSIPPSFLWWIELCQRNGVTKRAATKVQSVEPLIKSKWNQHEPFNGAIPTLVGNYKAFPTGCTATAISQIMNYWKYPERGIGSNSYNISYNGVGTLNFSANFGATRYDWNNMLDDYSGDYTQTQADAVATLMFHVGVAENTTYSGNSSNASSRDGAIAMMNNFDYDKSMKTANRSFYTDEEWEQLLYEELANGRPVYYSGRRVSENENVGHAFVIHGYDAEIDLYAVNWGWGGYCDGYFSLVGRNPLSPYEPGAYKIKGRSNSPYFNGEDSQEVFVGADTSYDEDDNKCNKKPNLKYEVCSVDADGKSYKMKGVCCDGVSQVKIALCDKSYKPDPKCNFEYHWTLEPNIGSMSNNDSPDGFIYTAPEDFPGNSNESTLTIKAKVHYSNGNPEMEGEKVVEIQLSRVPVVLVHGLNDNASTWSNFRYYLIAFGNYNPNNIYIVDYRKTNCSHYTTNLHVVDKGIKQAIENCKKTKFIATKCDVIGHSMGGILARLHVQYNGGSSNINKLISVNTPHSGSPLGDFFSELANEHPHFRDFITLFKVLGFSSTEAISDLALNSPAIDNYLNNPYAMAKMKKIPIHAVETQINISDLNTHLSSSSDWSVALSNFISNLEGSIENFFEGPSDGVVSIKSQRGGLTGHYSHFDGPDHVISPKISSVHKQLLWLLQQKNKSSVFCTSGFAPDDIKWTYNTNKIQKNGITRATNNTSQCFSLSYTNESFSIKYLNSDEYDIFATMVGLGNKSFIVSEEKDFIIDIPQKFQGEISILGLCKNSTTGEYKSQIDSIMIEASALKLLSVAFQKDINVLENDVNEIALNCFWSDNSESIEIPDSMVCSSRNISYEDGILTSLKAGDYDAKFYYRDKEVNCQIHIQSRGILEEVTPDDLYHGNNLDEPGYNSNQEIYYNIKPNEGGTYIPQIVSRDGIIMSISSNGYGVSEIEIDREHNGDKTLYFSFSPMNGGLHTAKFQYGVIFRNAVNGLQYVQYGGSTDNLTSKQLDPGYYFTKTISAKTDLMPFNGYYEVLPAFSVDGGASWKPMRFDVSTVVPKIVVYGGISPEKINLQMTLSDYEIQVGKTATFVYNNYYKGNIYYTSMHADIVEVSYDGTITALKEGNATIKVEITGDENFLPEEKLFDVCVVKHVMSPLLMSVSSTSLSVGETAKISFQNDYNGQISYSVAPSGILRVISDGSIIAVSEGRATISAFSTPTDDYYETVNAITVDVSSGDLDMPEELSISRIPTVGIDNVISEGNSTMTVRVYNNSSEFIPHATLYYKINLDGGRYVWYYWWADLQPGTFYTINHDLLDFKENMTPGKSYTCYFYKDSELTIPMNVPSVSFVYGKQEEIGVNLAESKYKTLSLPFDANIPNGMQAYSIKAYYENTLYLSEVSYLNRNHSYLICGNPDRYSFKGVVHPASENPQYGFMTGLHKELTIPKDNYVVNESGNQLRKVTNDVVGQRWSAYATLPTDAPATIPIITDGDNTGIKEIIANLNESSIIGIYSVDGIKRPKLQNGINIIKYSNGHSMKILVK